MQKNKHMGVVGLGNMGSNIASVLHWNGFNLAVYDANKDKIDAFGAKEEYGKNIYQAKSIEDLVSKLRKTGDKSITVWVMVPPDETTYSCVSELSDAMVKYGDGTIIDGSNSRYKDAISLYALQCGSYLDVGVAGGPQDVLKGPSYMIGGDRAAFKRTEHIFKALTKRAGTYEYVGGPGSGHFAKTVHNALFYAEFLMHANALELLDKSGMDSAAVMRAFSAAPPITNGIQLAMVEMLRRGNMEKADASVPPLKISPMVMEVPKIASDLGVQLEAIKAALDAYPEASPQSRVYHREAKRILVGH